ncbi:MAG: dTDP-4-dehydrorhamnose reductase [Candidatus Bathyarchaeota archaeon BA2]|nr:MAG: dTDP-4-dehydrorhamnose reductase [Candidatus Bathyarchaeota archaeon BA2]
MVTSLKLLVVGGSGLLGYKVAELAVGEFETFATYNFRSVELQGCNFFKLNKCDRSATQALIKKIKPDVVIDTAALHNVDYCETHHDEAWKVNVEGTRNVADACKETSAKMIFVSTDYVFDGKKGFYNEKDAPNPLHFYAKTKLEGEKVVREAGIDYAIVRPSVIYGWNPSELAGLRSSSGKSMNFAIWILNELRKRKEIKIVTDQYSSPTLADNLAEALLALSKSQRKGVYHTAGKICIDRFNFAKKIAEIFDLNGGLIKPVTSDVFKQVAERPKRCCLDVSKAERELEVKFLTVEEGLMKMKAKMEH